jgi:hypothetical protein
MVSQGGMAEMISFRLLLAALFWSGLALLIIELIWHFLEKKLALLKNVPSEMLEETGIGLFVSRYIMQLAFLVAVPSVIYSWFYVMVPFYGLRAGVGMAVFIFILGIVPFSVSVLIRIKLPLAFTLFHMAGYLIKTIIVYGIIAYLYIL